MPESLSAFCVQIKEVPQKLLSQKMKKMKLCHVTDVRLTMLLLLFSLFIQYNSFHGFQLKRHQMYQGIDAIHHQKLIHKILVLVNILFRYMKKKKILFFRVWRLFPIYFHFKGRKICPSNFIMILSRYCGADFHIRIPRDFHVTI